MNTVVIRQATCQDTTKLADLLAQMGYPQYLERLDAKIQSLLNNPQEHLLVAEYQQQVCGFLSLHFIPQLAVEGDFARISYFCIDEKFRNLKIGKTMLDYAETLAIQQGCDRMELHSAEYRIDAHRFYFNHDYIESPKYLTKKL